MALISIIQDFHPLNNSKLLERAAQLSPTLHYSVHEPVNSFIPDEYNLPRKCKMNSEDVSTMKLKKGDAICLDFGDHLVGYLTLSLSFSGSHPDAPAYLKLRFAETLSELAADTDAYDGWISRSWIQEEYIHVDLLPSKLSLPRRYAFRYLQVSVIDTSPKYQLTITGATCSAVTSADYTLVKPFSTGDELLDRIYLVSLRTLANCMQDVFEDGPKRDRRLWMGDLHLQALTNYISFRNYDLVKRCLYLFGGSRFPDGRISAAVFTVPSPEADDTYLFDYALLFVVAFEEYLEETGDEEALADLYDIAMQQVDYALSRLSQDNRLDDETIKDAFIDWGDSLDKNACAHAVLIYTLRYAMLLAQRKNDLHRLKELSRYRNELCKAVMDLFWDSEKGLFVSNGQISVASQVWMVLADVLPLTGSKAVMRKAISLKGGPSMTTPYQHHFYLMALLHTGLQEEAITHMKRYWGSMLDAGADTFWECWDGENPEFSPYGGSIVNSYCHAWSCTPAYIIHRFLFAGQ